MVDDVLTEPAGGECDVWEFEPESLLFISVLWAGIVLCRPVGVVEPFVILDGIDVLLRPLDQLEVVSRVKRLEGWVRAYGVSIA